MFAPRYFSPRYFAPRYWIPGVSIIVVEAAPSGVRKSRYVRLEKLPEPAYIDRYIDEEILKQLEDVPPEIKEIVDEVIYQYKQTGEEDEIVFIMFMLGWV